MQPSIYSNIEVLGFEPDLQVTLRYEQTADCFLMNEDEIETAMGETDVIDSLANLLATPGLNVSNPWHSDILEFLREDGYLEDYDRDGTFQEYLSELLSENFYDLELIDSSIEKYDHKRGSCTLSVIAHTTIENLMETRPNLHGWCAHIENGPTTVMLEG